MGNEKGGDKKIPIGIKLRFIQAAIAAGFEDINLYLDSVLDGVYQKEIQYKTITSELQKANAEIDRLRAEIETLNKKAE